MRRLRLRSFKYILFLFLFFWCDKSQASANPLTHQETQWTFFKTLNALYHPYTTVDRREQAHQTYALDPHNIRAQNTVLQANLYACCSRFMVVKTAIGCALSASLFFEPNNKYLVFSYYVALSVADFFSFLHYPGVNIPCNIMQDAFHKREEALYNGLMLTFLTGTFAFFPHDITKILIGIAAPMYMLKKML